MIFLSFSIEKIGIPSVFEGMYIRVILMKLKVTPPSSHISLNAISNISVAVTCTSDKSNAA